MGKLDYKKIAGENNKLIHELEKELIDIYYRLDEEGDDKDSSTLSSNIKWSMKKIADIKINNKILGKILE